MIDYKSLLERYMDRVYTEEGATFVPGYNPVYDTYSRFSKEEILELERIDDIVREKERLRYMEKGLP